MKTRRVILGLLLAAGALLLQGCQFLQNEFFTLDRVGPDLEAHHAAIREAARW